MCKVSINLNSNYSIDSGDQRVQNWDLGITFVSIVKEILRSINFKVSWKAKTASFVPMTRCRGLFVQTIKIVVNSCKKNTFKK